MTNDLDNIFELIFGILLAVGALLMLLTHLEATLDRPASKPTSTARIRSYLSRHLRASRRP